MRHAALVLPLLLLACGGDDTKSDASADATLDVDAGADAPADVAVDVPPVPAIWVASPTTLYTLDPDTHVIKRVADFDCSGEPMIDLAMNAKEELFGITTESVVRIDKTSGVCTVLARGSQDLPYATGFVPLDGGEAWRGYQISTFDDVDPDSGALGFVGSLVNDAGSAFQASGDMVALGDKTYLTTFDFDPNSGDVLVEVDRATGAVTKVDGKTGVAALLGLAQWAGVIYAFADNGRVYTVDPTDAGVTLKVLGVSYDLGDAGADADAGDADLDAESDADASGASSFIRFRGAAVTTRAPIQ